MSKVLAKYRDRSVLPIKSTRERIELLLTRRGECCQIVAIALERHASREGPAAPMGSSARLRSCNDPHKATRDPSLGDVELTLSLTTGFLHAKKLNTAVRSAPHVRLLCAQPKKSDGPS